MNLGRSCELSEVSKFPTGGGVPPKICEYVWKSDIECLMDVVEEEGFDHKNIRAFNGFGALHFASACGTLDSLHLLLGGGMNVDQLDKHGSTPLIWAVRNGFGEIVEELVLAGANLNHLNYVGESPLSLAVASNEEDIAAFLLEHGANPNICDLDGVCPLHSAAEAGNLSMISSLLYYGASVSAKDHDGDTAMHWAVRGNQTGVVRELVEAGASLDQRNDDGESPRDLAACFGTKLVLSNREEPVAMAGNSDSGTSSPQESNLGQVGATVHTENSFGRRNVGTNMGGSSDAHSFSAAIVAL